MDVLIAATIGGIGIGLVYALMATGFYLVFDILDILNLAHGIYVILAAYTVRMLMLNGFPGGGGPVSVYVAVPVAIGFATVMGYLIQKVIFTPLIRHTGGASKEIIIVSSFGVVFAGQQIWGNLTLYEPVSNPFPIDMPSISFGSASVDMMVILLGFVSLLILLVFYTFMHRTMFGKTIRSVDQNEMGARLSGISPKRMYNYTHLFCGLLTGIAGVTISFIRPVHTGGILNWTVFSFIVVMLGGIIWRGEENTILSLLVAGPLIGVVLSIMGRLGYSRWMDFSLYLVLFVLILAINVGTSGDEEVLL